MSRFARLAGLVAFVLAACSQSLALDACAVSCEAARAAQTPALAAPCHHTTSCATQISQPAPTGATAAAPAVLPPLAAASLAPPARPSGAERPHGRATSQGPPLITSLRL